MLKPIKRANMRNALIGALAQEGVNVTPDVMDKALVRLSEGDPRPEGMPESITIGGIVLAWPRGRETRVPGTDERNRWNTALKHVESNEVITEEHNVRLYRELFEALMEDVKNDPSVSLPRLTVREIAAAQAIVEAEKPVVVVEPAPVVEVTPPVIEHTVPTDVNVNALDALLADLAALAASLG